MAGLKAIDLEAIFIVGFSIASFISVLLLLKKNKTQADKILATWMAFLSIHIFLFYLQDSGLVFQVPFLIGFTLPIPVLHGLFLFLYAKELLFKNAFSSWLWVIHLLPFILLVILGMPFFLSDSQEKINVMQNEGKGYEWYILLQMIMFIGSGVAYGIATLRTVLRYKRKVLNFVSNTDKQMLKWLEYLVIGLSTIWMLTVLADDVIIFSGATFFVIFIGVYGFIQVPVYFIQPLTSPNQVAGATDTDPIPEKYQRSGLTPGETTELFEKAVALMKKHELYKNSNVTLTEMAQLLSVSPTYLSQAINSQSNGTFYQFVNEFRVEAFIQKMDEQGNRKYTLLAIAYDCGFNSKSTFNKHFKKYTGKTPSEYFSAID